MKTIGVVGAGTMGRGIAHVTALAGYNVFLNDVSDALLAKSIAVLSADLSKGIEKGKLTEDDKHGTLSRIQTQSGFDCFASCELIVEAAVERIDVKHDIFRRLEAICAPTAILASNTSSLSITEIASVVTRAERVVGLHFFNPPHLMKLVEVVSGHRTSDETTRASVAFVRKLGRIPVSAKDTPGFIVNRVARPFYGEALRLLGEGVASVEDIDRIVKLEGGFKMGPFELMDLIGIDVNFAVTQSMYEQSFGEPRYRPHIIQKNMVSAGLLGRKTKRGFYNYES